MIEGWMEQSGSTQEQPTITETTGDQCQRVNLRVNLQNLRARLVGRQREEELAVESSGPTERRVDAVQSVLELIGEGA